MRTTQKSLRNKVIYQVFTRNFGNGTFSAVKDQLDRIRALGVDYIYLLPIHPSGEVQRKGSMGSPYAIKDYRAIDPVQGTMDEFIALSEAIHEKGMKLVIDIVFNHTSPDSFLATNHPEWFYRKPDGTMGNRMGDWWDVIDLDYSHKELWEYQIETLKMWAQYVDGFRCDVAPLVSLEFWKEARDEVEKVRPGCLWIAESIEMHSVRANRQAGVATLTDAELYQVFDICYDYDIYDSMKLAMTGAGKVSDFTRAMDLQEGMYPENYCKLRCLENHDRPRAAALVPEDRALRNWTAFQFFAKGAVMLYNGQEYEAMHHPTLFDHDPIETDTGKDISGFLKKLSMIKKDPLLAEGTYQVKTIGKNEDVIVAEYHQAAGTTTEYKRAIGIFSTTGTRQSLPVELENGQYRNEIDGEMVDVFENTMCFTGEPVILFLS